MKQLSFSWAGGGCQLDPAAGRSRLSRQPTGFPGMDCSGCHTFAAPVASRRSFLPRVVSFSPCCGRVVAGSPDRATTGVTTLRRRGLVRISDLEIKCVVPGTLQLLNTQHSLCSPSLPAGCLAPAPRSALDWSSATTARMPARSPGRCAAARSRSPTPTPKACGTRATCFGRQWPRRSVCDADSKERIFDTETPYLDFRDYGAGRRGRYPLARTRSSKPSPARASSTHPISESSCGVTDLKSVPPSGWVE